MEDIKGLTLFKIYMDYLVRNGVKSYIETFYTLKELEITDTYVKIDTDDKLFNAISMYICDNEIYIYKKKRASDIEFIFRWYNGKVMTIDTIDYCDTEEEYQHLTDMVRGVLPFIQEMYEKNNSMLYLSEETFIKKLKVTYDEHMEVVGLTKRFMSDVEKLYDFDIKTTIYSYYSYENYMKGLTTSFLIDDTAMIIFTTYNNEVRIINGDKLAEKYPVFLKIASYVLVMRLYSKYYRGLMEQEVGKKIETKRGARFR